MTVLVMGGMGVIGSRRVRELAERGLRFVGDVPDLTHLVEVLIRLRVERVVRRAGLAAPPWKRIPATPAGSTSTVPSLSRRLPGARTSGGWRKLQAGG